MKPLNNRQTWFQRRQAQIRETRDILPGRGDLGGRCNRTLCQKPSDEDPDGIRWFNHSTQRYYCRECAGILNRDPVNRQDAQEIWGHDLCTLKP